MEDRETSWSYCQGDKTGTFYTAERKWINKIHKLKEQYPDDVDIRVVNDDGSIIAHLPEDWIRVSPPRKLNMSDEQKAEKRRLLEIARLRKKEIMTNGRT